jgi:hypothetical protein
MARGGHGLLKVSLGPAMPYLLHPAGEPPLKRPNSRFRGGPQSGWLATIFYPRGHPTLYAYASHPQFENKVSCFFDGLVSDPLNDFFDRRVHLVMQGRNSWGFQGSGKVSLGTDLILERARVPVAHFFVCGTLKNCVLCPPGTLRILIIFVIQNCIHWKKTFLVI